MLGCDGVLSKAPLYAVERIKAIRKAGYTKSEHMLIGKTGFAYDGYWTTGERADKYTVSTICGG